MATSQKDFADLKVEEDLTCSAYSSFEELESMRAEWDDFVESVNGDIYLTFDWCRIWWKHYGLGRDLRIFVFRSGFKLVGLIPFVVDSIRLGLMKLKIAKIVGTDSTLEIVNPPIQQKFAKTILGQVCENLFNVDCCDVVCWGPISDSYSTAIKLKEYLYNFGNVSTSHLGYFTIFDLPDNIDIYLESLGKSVRKHYYRGLRNLGAGHNLECTMLPGTREDFDRFVKMHGEQWRRINKLGHFDDWPGAYEFHSDMVEAHRRLGRLRLVCLRADGEPVAYRYVYRFSNRYYSFLPARLCGTKWDKYGLGIIGHIMTVDKAIEEGVTQIDAGRGHDEHKINLGGQEHPVVSFLITRKSLGSIVRIRLFSVISWLLNLLYYRIWFKHLVSCLPIKRQPLWKLWIRTRL
jgi:hypothetical protein